MACVNHLPQRGRVYNRILLVDGDAFTRARIAERPRGGGLRNA
jgi:hypothetical protein